MPLNRGEFDDVLLPFLDGMRYKMSNSKRWHGTRTWETTPVQQLVECLRGEVAELEEALRDGSPLEGFLEAVDVGNVAMMIADRLGMLRERQVDLEPVTEAAAAPAQRKSGTDLWPGTCPHGYADHRYCRQCQHPSEPVFMSHGGVPLGPPGPPLAGGGTGP